MDPQIADDYLRVSLKSELTLMSGKTLLCFVVIKSMKTVKLKLEPGGLDFFPHAAIILNNIRSTI